MPSINKSLHIHIGISLVKVKGKIVLNREFKYSCIWRSSARQGVLALFFKNDFVYFWLCWVFVAVLGFSSCGEWGLLSSCGSVIVAYWLSCSKPYGVFPDQGLNLHFLHWQADSSSPSHQERPCSWPSKRKQFRMQRGVFSPSGWSL